MPAVGQRLKALRKARKLSTRELAARSGVSSSLVSKVEAGQVAPTIASLHKLVASMDVELWEFFTDTPASDPSDQIVFKKADMNVSEGPEHAGRIAFPRDPRIKGVLGYDVFFPHTRPMEKVIHRCDMLGMVLSGELTLEIEERGTFKAVAGDAYYVKAGVAHRPVNNGSKPVKLISVLLISSSNGR
jgi:transcriptional regulator with XRE-family HTH domain